MTLSNWNQISSDSNFIQLLDAKAMKLNMVEGGANAKASSFLEDIFVSMTFFPQSAPISSYN